MAADVPLPSVVLFLEGRGGREVFQKLVSGLQRGGRRVHVIVRTGLGERAFTADIAAKAGERPSFGEHVAAKPGERPSFGDDVAAKSGERPWRPMGF